MTDLLTYYEAIGDEEKRHVERSLLFLWVQHHRKLFGGNCRIRILFLDDAKRHPLFKEYDRAVGEFPTANFANLDRACFRRWLAAAGTEGGFLMDYDCFIYDPEPFLKLQPTDTLALFHPTEMGITLGTKVAFADACWAFMRYQPNGADTWREKPHVSDMTILRQHREVKRLALMRVFRQPGWRTAPAVHYTYAPMSFHHQLPRYQTIPKLR